MIGDASPLANLCPRKFSLVVVKAGKQMAYNPKSRPKRKHGQIWRASVLGITIYVFLFSITAIWILHASTRNEYTDRMLTPFYGGFSLYEIVSLLNAVWLFILGVESGAADAPFCFPTHLAEWQTRIQLSAELCYQFSPWQPFNGLRRS